jgi:hypothetical protein
MKSYAFLPALFVAVLTAVACGDDGNDNPAPPDVTTGGKNNGAGTGNKAGNGGKNDGGAGNTSDGGGPDTSNGGQPPTDVGGQGQGGDAPVPQPTCDLPVLGEDGCFNCPENGVVEQFLNRCTEGDIVEFDNDARLPLLEDDGSRPDLPN